MRLQCPFSVRFWCCCSRFFFFFNDTATTEIYTLSLHDALPICQRHAQRRRRSQKGGPEPAEHEGRNQVGERSEEHTSELQSPCNLVCRLLLEKKNKPFPLRTPPRTVWRD